MDVIFDRCEFEIDQPHDWRKMTIWKNEKHEIPSKALHNVVVALTARMPFKGIFAYDEFSHEVIVRNRPPWVSVDSFTPRRVQDWDVTSLLIELERLKYQVNINMLSKAVEVAAMSNRIHPAREYFSNLKWDGVSRIDNWLAYYCGCETEPHEYLSVVGAKFLIAAVTRVFHPGTKFDHMLILEGNQRAGKSSALKALATIGGIPYFSDTITIDKIEDKDSTMKLQGRLIIEFAELAGFAKKETSDLKRWITMECDECRMPYDRHLKNLPRQFVIAGTNNPFQGWMNDPTGSRRFWPVTVGRKIDMTALKNDVEQLWAEAVDRYRKGEQIYMTDEMEAIADEVRVSRQAVDVWEDFISSEFSAFNEVSTDDIFAALKIERNKQSNMDSRRIGAIMRKLGFISKKTNKRKWVR